MWAVDPRRTESAKFADVWLGINVGSDIALANGIAREIIDAGLENKKFNKMAGISRFIIGYNFCKKKTRCSGYRM